MDNKNSYSLWLIYLAILGIFLFHVASSDAYDTQAKQIKTDTSSFTGILDASDTDVQKALQTMDGMVVGGISFGNEGEVPFTNSTADDFNYSSNLSFDGTNFILGNDLQVGNNISINNNLLVSNDLQVNNDAQVDFDLQVGNDVQVDNDLTTTRDIYVGNDLLVDNDSLLGNDLFVQGEVEIDGTTITHDDVIIEGDVTIEGVTRIFSPDSARIPLVVEGAAGQVAYLTQWQDSTSQDVAYVQSNGRMYLDAGLRATSLPGGGSLILSNSEGIEVKAMITDITGNFDLTGGSQPNLFTDTVNDPFGISGVGVNDGLVIKSGSHMGAMAKIIEIVDDENAVLHTMGWDFDLTGVNYMIMGHPQMVVGDADDIEFYTSETGHVVVSSSQAYIGTEDTDVVFSVNSFMGADETEGVEFETHAQGYSGVSSLEVEIHGGDLQPGDKVDGITVEIYDAGNSSADNTTEYDGLVFTTTNLSDAEHHAIHVHTGFDKALVVSGSPEDDPGYGYEVTSGSVVDRVTGTPQDGTAFLDTSTSDLELFDSNGDYILIGCSSKFEVIQVSLAVDSSRDIRADFFYSAGAGVWTEFYPTDGTNGFTSSGDISFSSPSGWVADDEAESNGDITNAYYIKIERTRSWGITTLPIEDHFKIFASSSSGMLVRGDGSIQPTTAVDTAMSNDSIYYSSVVGKLVYKDSSGVVHDLY